MIEKKESLPDKVAKDTTFGELIQKYPDTVPILLEYGLHCIGCHVAVFETIEQGAKGHGLSEAQLTEMIEKINDSIKEKK
ncbi:MAG: DUF1858 domain-containing protein [Candidatus Diapherotrites archaeon]|nr:DUF1858 domain-containing protein [Candidatus Diapherotrites archaeon]